MSKAKIATPRELEKLEKRVDGLRQIDPNLDLSNGLSVQAAEALIANLRSLVQSYNSLLAEIDARANDIKTKKVEMNDYNARLLAAVAARYGRNSNEYKLTGGVPLKERKRPKRKETA